MFLSTLALSEVFQRLEWSFRLEGAVAQGVQEAQRWGGPGLALELQCVRAHAEAGNLTLDRLTGLQVMLPWLTAEQAAVVRELTEGLVGAVVTPKRKSVIGKTNPKKAKAGSSCAGVERNADEAELEALNASLFG